MSLLGGLTGSNNGKDGKSSFDGVRKVLLVVVGIVVVYALLPTLQQWLTQMANEATSFLFNTGPKIALGAGGLGLALRLVPGIWRRHGGRMVVEACFCAFGLALAPRAFAWLSGPAPDLAMNVVNAGGAIVHTVSTGVGGVGG